MFGSVSLDLIWIFYFDLGIHVELLNISLILAGEDDRGVHQTVKASRGGGLRQLVFSYALSTYTMIFIFKNKKRQKNDEIKR